MQFDVKTNWARPFLHSILFLSCCFVNGALQEDLMHKLVDPTGGTPLIRLRSPRAHLHSVLLKWKRCHSKALKAGEHPRLIGPFTALPAIPPKTPSRYWVG